MHSHQKTSSLDVWWQEYGRLTETYLLWDFLPSGVTNRPVQDTKNLTRTSDCYISNSHSDISNQPSTPGLKTGPAISQSNLHHASPVEIRHFPKAEAIKETWKRKPRVSAVLTDAPVKATLEAEVEALPKPIKRNRLFSYSQEKTRKWKKIKIECSKSWVIWRERWQWILLCWICRPLLHVQSTYKKVSVHKFPQMGPRPLRQI
jgi:hypothetical protein